MKSGMKLWLWLCAVASSLIGIAVTITADDATVAIAATATGADDDSDTPYPLTFKKTSLEQYKRATAAGKSRERKLWCHEDQTTNTNKHPLWHPVYAAGWTNGYCRFHVDCDSPGYATELACCKSAYAGQMSGYCFRMLPSPPTTSPTETGGLSIYYPDYKNPWDQSYCINTRPLPSGRPTYSSMLVCCKSAYAGQMSGKCISMLPSPPSTSPTNSNREAPFWYPLYEVAWDRSGCSNRLPLPYNNVNDRPRYDTGEGCCAAAYGGQSSRTCICGLPTPTLGCPGIVMYTATTTTATVSSTLTLGGNLAVPSDATEKAALISSLESIIFGIVAASLEVDGGTLEEVTIISIGSQYVRRRILLLRRLAASTNVEVQTVISNECTGNTCRSGDAVGRDMYVNVNGALSNTGTVQSAFQSSSNAALRGVTVQGVTVNPNVETARKTKTVVGSPPKPPRTQPPSLPPTAPPTRPPTQPPTKSPTSPPTTGRATNEPSPQPSTPPSYLPSLDPSSAPSSAPLTTESATNEPSPLPSTLPSLLPTLDPSIAPSSTPSSVPSTFDILGDEFMFDGNGVSFPSQTEVVMQSDSDHGSQFGAVIAKHAFNEADVDFQVDYTQLSFADHVGQTGYESQLYIFFAEEGTYPETLLQTDNNFGEFESLTVGYLRSKVFTTDPNNTWLSCGTAETSQSAITSPKHLEFSLRLRRLNNIIHAYYGVPGDSTWVNIGQPMNIPQVMHNVPIQFGFRVKKEWKKYHHFSVSATKLAGGPPLPIPTKVPTSAPTETRTWINPGTNYKEPVCPTALDRSNVSGNMYEVRGIGGGGAMSGLSISPWNDLWFVGTDMGTLFRSTDGGRLWYPVSHYEAKFHSRLHVSAPVGYTSDPSIVLHAACHVDADDVSKNHPCVAQRSVDGGITWTPINLTGGARVNPQQHPILDEIPMSWYGSLTENSGIVYCIVFGSGNIYRSADDGANWSRVILPSVLNTANPAVGFYLDESSSARYIYFATSHGIYMWKEGSEDAAREIYASDGTNFLQSFTGARTGGTLALMLSFVDNDIAACPNHDPSIGDCGFVHTFRQDLTTVEAEQLETFAFTKTSQSGFRVESSRTDSDRMYVTGARSWPSSTGTKVFVGTYDSAQHSFAYTLKFRQYPLWDSDKLDYSGVGIDVGYWDGGYYTWNVKPNDFDIAGGSGNFFLHVTRNGGDHWESPFTEYADGCNTNGERVEGRRWRSTGLEMTSVRWLKFNPFNISYAYASVADIRMLRSDDGGNTFEITGGDNTDPLFRLNTVYDYDFAGVHTIFAVGGNFHDWPHEWYKNLRRGAGGVYVSFNSGDNWHRVGAEASSNCDDRFFNVDCSLGDDMVRQILSVYWDENVGGGTLYVGTQSAGVARLEGLNNIFLSGTIEQMQDLQFEWINDGLGTENGRIIPEIKERNGYLFCLLTGNAPDFTNNQDVGLYQFDHASSSWTLKKGVVNRHHTIASHWDLWAYPTSFDIDPLGNLWLVDIETNGNYQASGIWKSSDDGDTWDRVQQFTFPYYITCIGDRIYASGARSISHIGHAGWGDGGAMFSDDEGVTWQKNEDIPLLSNLNSVVEDPADATQVFYTFFGGGMLHGPRP